MMLDFWIPLENTRRQKYSNEKNNIKKQKTTTTATTKRKHHERVLQHVSVEPEKTAT